MAFGAVLDFPEVLSLRRRDFAVLHKYADMHLQYNWISSWGLNLSLLQSSLPPGDQHPRSKDFLYTMTKNSQLKRWEIQNTQDSAWVKINHELVSLEVI